MVDSGDSFLEHPRRIVYFFIRRKSSPNLFSVSVSVWVKAFKTRHQSRNGKGKTFVRKEEAERILEGYLKPVLGFALKRCRSSEDAEDLSQEITLKAYRALLVRDDVEDAGKFIWTVAHNALCNYYRNAPKNVIGIPVEEIEEILACPETEEENKETAKRLRQEIA